MNAVVVAAAMCGAIAVAAGAFGAHGAEGKAAEWLRTGAEYQLIHVLAALIAVSLGKPGPAWAFIGGGLIFAATLYAMAIGGPRWLGAVTPIGGATLIVGWLWLAWTAMRG